MFNHSFCRDLNTELLYTVIHLCSKVYNATSTQSEINLTAKELIFVTSTTAKDVAYIYLDLEGVAYGV